MLPVIPLFMIKTTQVERSNNGNLAFDASWRLPGRLRIYSEFLIDDIQSPTALFDDTVSGRAGDGSPNERRLSRKLDPGRLIASNRNSSRFKHGIPRKSCFESGTYA